MSGRRSKQLRKEAAKVIPEGSRLKWAGRTAFWTGARHYYRLLKKGIIKMEAKA